VNCTSYDIPRRAVRRSWQCPTPPLRLVGACALLALLFAGCSGGRRRAPVVAIQITEDGFVPRRIEVPAGTPLTLEFRRVTKYTCADEVVVDGVTRHWELPLNHPVRIALEKGVRDSLGFACGMDMYHGVLVAR